MKPLRTLLLTACLLPLSLWAAKVGEEAPIGGQELQLAEGATLRLMLEEGQFRLYQIDAKGKVMEPTLERANMRVEEQRAKNVSNFLNLGPVADSGAWGNERKFTPPHRYWVILNLWTQGAQEPRTERFLLAQ